MTTSPTVFTCRCVIHLASVLVPGNMRGEWTYDWIAEVWHGYARFSGRGVSRVTAWAQLLRFALGAFTGARDLRRSRFKWQRGRGPALGGAHARNTSIFSRCICAGSDWRNGFSARAVARDSLLFFETRADGMRGYICLGR